LRRLGRGKCPYPILQKRTAQLPDSIGEKQPSQREPALKTETSGFLSSEIQKENFSHNTDAPEKPLQPQTSLPIPI